MKGQVLTIQPQSAFRSEHMSSHLFLPQANNNVFSFLHWFGVSRTDPTCQIWPAIAYFTILTFLFFRSLISFQSQPAIEASVFAKLEFSDLSAGEVPQQRTRKG